MPVITLAILPLGEFAAKGISWLTLAGMLMPIGGFPPTLVRQNCIVEWTVANGATKAYRWQGNGCRSVNLSAAQP